MVDVREAHAFAVETFAQHGALAAGWTVDWDRSARRAGVANYRTRTVTLSARAVEAWDWPLVQALVIHELAHAMLGPGAAHGPLWRQQVKALGGVPEKNCPRFSSGLALFGSRAGEGGNMFFLWLLFVACWIAAPAFAAVVTLVGGVWALVAASRASRPVLSLDERRQIERDVFRV